MKNNDFRRKALVICASIVTFFAASAASASQYQIESSVAGWRIQTYTGTTIALWYTGSSCVSGGLLLPASESADRNKLLAAMVLSAKATGAKMAIGYDVDNGSCIITDFAIDGP